MILFEIYSSSICFISSPTLIQLETTISIQVKWAWHHIPMDRIRKQYDDREIFQRID